MRRTLGPHTLPARLSGLLSVHRKPALTRQLSFLTCCCFREEVSASAAAFPTQKNHLRTIGGVVFEHQIADSLTRGTWV